MRIPVSMRVGALLAVACIAAGLVIFLRHAFPPVFNTGVSGGASDEERARHQLHVFADAMWEYERTEGHHPESMRSLLESSMWGMTEELERRAAMQDPWGSPYVLEQTADRWTLRSAGPDRALGTSDDIVVPQVPED